MAMAAAFSWCCRLFRGEKVDGLLSSLFVCLREECLSQCARSQHTFSSVSGRHTGPCVASSSTCRGLMGDHPCMVLCISARAPGSEAPLILCKTMSESHEHRCMSSPVCSKKRPTPAAVRPSCQRRTEEQNNLLRIGVRGNASPRPFLRALCELSRCCVQLIPCWSS